jgi:hypothetical protein
MLTLDTGSALCGELERPPSASDCATRSEYGVDIFCAAADYKRAVARTRTRTPAYVCACTVRLPAGCALHALCLWPLSDALSAAGRVL